MGRIDREAFVVSPKAEQRVHRLSQAIHEAEILPVIGGSGVGKDRFLDWWWQAGCMEYPNASFGTVIQPEDILLVSAQPSPAGTMPVGCALFTKIWLALQELDRARQRGERPRALGHTKPCNPDRVASLVYENIYPLMDELQPLAIVISDAQYLNKQTLGTLLELRTSIRRNRPKMARCALILCASIETDQVATSGFSKLLNNVKETRTTWPNKLIFTPMDIAEFSVIMTKLIRRNLNAVFGEDVVGKEVIQDFATWTDMNWWFIVELVKVLDRSLGPQYETKPRVLNRKVLEYVEQTWVKRQPVAN